MNNTILFILSLISITLSIILLIGILASKFKNLNNPNNKTGLVFLTILGSLCLVFEIFLLILRDTDIIILFIILPLLLFSIVLICIKP